MQSHAALLLLIIMQSSTTRSREPDLVGIVVVIVVAFLMVALVIFVVIAIVVSARRRADRASKLRAVAQQLGFSFTPKPPVPDFLHNTKYAQWYPAVGTGIHNLLSGKVHGRSVLIFDFGYTRTLGGTGSATYRETVVCIPRDAAEPFTFYRERTLVAPEQYQVFLNSALQSLAQG